MVVGGGFQLLHHLLPAPLSISPSELFVFNSPVRRSGTVGHASLEVTCYFDFDFEKRSQRKHCLEKSVFNFLNYTKHLNLIKFNSMEVKYTAALFIPFLKEDV